MALTRRVYIIIVFLCISTRVGIFVVAVIFRHKLVFNLSAKIHVIC